MAQERRGYRFGPYRVDPAEKLLYRDDAVVALPPKAMETLLVLVESKGQLVWKEDLIKKVWPDTFVEEGGLAKNISLLRKALGDDSDDNRFIETIPKKGYRFVAPVADGSDQAATETPAPVPRRISRRTIFAGATGAAAAAAGGALWLLPRTGREIHSLVVLPLEELSGDPNKIYFAAGMTEALKTNLTQIAALTVKSGYFYGRKLKEERPAAAVAADLDVDAALEGSVLITGQKVRVDVRVVRAGSGEHRWANFYEGSLSDVLELQGRIAREIAAEIRVQVTPQEQSRLSTFRKVGEDAYLAYVQGLWFWNQRTGEGLMKSLEYFGRAVQSDPKLALAYCGLADTYTLLGSMPMDALRPTEAKPKAVAAAKAALAIDDSLAAAHTSMGNIRLTFEWDWRAAEQEFQKAIALNPGYSSAHHWYSHAMLAAGRHQEALAKMQRAFTLAPASLIIHVGVGWCHYHAGQQALAVEQYRKVLELDPNFLSAHFALGLALGQMGRHDEAVAELDKTLALTQGRLLTAIAAKGKFQARGGDRAGAEKAVVHLQAMEKHRYVPALYHAVLNAALGQKDLAYAAAQKAFGERSDYLVYARHEPMLDDLRGDPRFLALAQKAGLD